MFKRPNVQFFSHKGHKLENNLVNIDLSTEVYKVNEKHEFKGCDYILYRIVFLMVNQEEVVWSFNDKEDRDLQYYDL